MLQITDASIAYGEDVLFSGFNLHLPPGRMACIAGESGRGKTSLLNAIMGFVPLRTGQIRVGKTQLSSSTIEAVRRQIAWIPQELALPMEWVTDMVHLPFELKANKKRALFSKKGLFDRFEELGLDTDLYYKRVSEVSGGQRQRMMLAVATLLQKPLIIIDEPTSALDGISMDRVLAFFQNASAGGTTVLAVSHDPGFAAGCDEIIYL